MTELMTAGLITSFTRSALSAQSTKDSGLVSLLSVATCLKHLIRLEQDAVSQKMCKSLERHAERAFIAAWNWPGLDMEVAIWR